nr:hypothetical protein [uncultured Psychroserpens sp.]
MLDNLKVLDIENSYSIPSRTEPFRMFDAEFFPRYNQKGKYTYHSATFENLVAKITGGRFTLENSLNKFVHGNNYNDFTHSEIINAIERIENKFKISSGNLKLKRLETAVNFQSKVQLYKLFGLYVMDEFENMRKGKTIYGKKFYGSEYNVKDYDKTLETKLNGDLDAYGNKELAPNGTNRFEIEYKKMRPLNGVLVTLSDLRNKAVLEKLGLMILKCFDKVEILKDYNYSILTPRERELVFAGYSSQFWEVEKLNMNTRKEKRSRFKKCIKKLDSDLTINPKNETRNLMLEKINYLVSN